MVRRPVVLLLALAVVALVVAIPVLAASPAPSPRPPAQGPKDKAPETPVTLSGTVTASTDADGRTTYSIKSGGVTYSLEAGPPWFYGDAYPLKPYVGKAVTIVGEKAATLNSVDVLTIDGTALREPGRPPWAGGWKAVGKAHPGWSQAKADRSKAKFGDCFPPGRCKSKPDAAASSTP